jgi:MFS family permease
MVGGTIADIWRPHEWVFHFYTCFRLSHGSRRSLPMSIYSFAAVGGIGLGPVAAGWVEMNLRLQWRWIQWIHMMFVILFYNLYAFTDFL